MGVPGVYGWKVVQIGQLRDASLSGAFDSVSGQVVCALEPARCEKCVRLVDTYVGKRLKIGAVQM